MQSNKGVANGYAALDAASKVVQDPASAQLLPAANKIPVSGGEGRIADGWLSANVSLLGSTINLSSEVTGLLPNSALANDYSGVGACTNQFVRALNDNAAPTCATVQKADGAGTFVHNDQSNTYSAGLKQTFSPNASSAGLNIGAHTADPSTLADGDVWYNSSTNKFRCRENGTSKDCIGTGGSSPLTIKGDLHTYDSADARLPAGANYQVLKSDSTESTGLKWVDGSTVLDRNTAENDVVNTNSETSVYSVTIPAGALGTSRMVQVLIFGDYNNNSGGNATVTVRVKWAGVTIYADASANIASASGLRPMRVELSLANLGATNAQFFRGFVEIGVQNNATTGFGDLGSTAAVIRQPIGTTTGLTANTTSAQTLEVTVQHSVANANTSIRRKYALATIQ